MEAGGSDSDSGSGSGSAVRVDMDGDWTPAGAARIREVAEVFRHFAFAPGAAADWRWLRIAGAAFLPAWADWEFWVYPASRDGAFLVEAARAGHGECYMFGLAFEPGAGAAHAYHHGHGPFPTLYGAVERDVNLPV